MAVSTLESMEVDTVGFRAEGPGSFPSNPETTGLGK